MRPYFRSNYGRVESFAKRAVTTSDCLADLCRDGFASPSRGSRVWGVASNWHAVYRARLSRNWRARRLQVRAVIRDRRADHAELFDEKVGLLRLTLYGVAD